MCINVFLIALKSTYFSTCLISWSGKITVDR